MRHRFTSPDTRRAAPSIEASAGRVAPAPRDRCEPAPRDRSTQAPRDRFAPACTARIAGGLAALGAALPAAAHHPMGGATPGSAFQGLLSGIGHPVIGLDHLAFLVCAALLAALYGRLDGRRALACGALFAVAGAVGTLLRVLAPDLPVPDMLVAITAVAAGGALLLGRSPRGAAVLLLALLAGVLHGHAFGEAIVGAEPTPLLAYLAGLAATQLGLLGLAFAAGRGLLRAAPQHASAVARFAGVAAVAVGLGAAALAAGGLAG